MLSPKKSFGQNFLINPLMIAKIIELLQLTTLSEVLEIGPGTGALTKHLITHAKKVVAVELDRDLIPVLDKKFGQHKNFTLINQDILTVDLTAIPLATPYKIIGNLPYNISTPILFKVLQHATLFSNAYFMLQKEVALRLVASENSKQYGKLTVMAKFFADIEILIDVTADNFYPIPKVCSSIVKITPKQGNIDLAVFNKLNTVTQAAFNMRRKTIANALKHLINATDLAKLAINPKLRAENLTLTDYIKIATRL